MEKCYNTNHHINTIKHESLLNKHLEEAMRALYLIPGLVCLFLGGIFLLVYRSSRIKQETTDRDVTAQTWGGLSIRKAKRNVTIRIERVPYFTASMNMRPRTGNTFHLPLTIAIILCRMSQEQRETRLNSYTIRKSRLSLFFLKSRLLSKQSGLNSGKPESD